MKRSFTPIPKSKSAVPVPLKAPEVELWNVGLTVGIAVDAALVAPLVAAVVAALVAALIGCGVVGLGDLCTVSNDASRETWWRQLRGIIVRLCPSYKDADSNSYCGCYHNCSHRYPEPFSRHPAY